MKNNGTDFEMMGMLQEYASTVTDWKDGRLEGMVISVSGPIEDESKYEPIIKNSITSDNPLLQELEPKVYSLGIQF